MKPIFTLSAACAGDTTSNASRKSPLTIVSS
jgi:hypothetical protein